MVTYIIHGHIGVIGKRSVDGLCSIHTCLHLKGGPSVEKLTAKNKGMGVRAQGCVY